MWVFFVRADFLSNKKLCHEDFSGLIQTWAWNAMRGRHTSKYQLKIMSTPVVRGTCLVYFLLSTVSFILWFMHANYAYIKVCMPQ